MRPVGYPKTGGRQKGTPNKSTNALIEILESRGLDPVVQLTEVFGQLEPKEQADICLKLMEYLYPRRKATEISFEEEIREAFKPTMEDMKALIRIARENPKDK